MWKQQIPDWIPFATAITGKVPMNSPWVTRLAELVIVGIVSGVSTFKSLEYDVAALNTKLVAHEKQNSDYRADMEKKRTEETRVRAEEDRKWDIRIQRIENCFILRNCGTTR